MDSRFADLVQSLEDSLHRLLSAAPVRVTELPKQMPKAGIYVFSEGGRHLYVGRTRNLRRRVQEHSRPSASHNSAVFAFLLAREATGKLDASYQPEGSRASLLRDPEFARAFEQAKERIRNMELRYVEEANPLRQALLEIYAAVVLETCHNNFDTH